MADSDLAAATAPVTSDGASTEVKDETKKLSALRANIEKGGKMSYYYAHGNTPKEQISFHGLPKRIEEPAEGAGAGTAAAVKPAVRKTTIEKYAWADGDKSVSIYVDFAGLEALPEDAVTVTQDGASFELVIAKAEGDKQHHHVLKLGPLSGEITAATIKRKPASLVLRLTKKNVGDKWFDLLKTAAASS